MITDVEYPPHDRPDPATVTFTAPLPERDVRDAIGYVVAAADRTYAIDLITVLQVRARLAEDTGERISLADFATEEGLDLSQFRP